MKAASSAGTDVKLAGDEELRAWSRGVVKKTMRECSEVAGGVEE